MHASTEMTEALTREIQDYVVTFERRLRHESTTKYFTEKARLLQRAHIVGKESGGMQGTPQPPQSVQALLEAPPPPEATPGEGAGAEPPAGGQGGSTGAAAAGEQAAAGAGAGAEGAGQGAAAGTPQGTAGGSSLIGTVIGNPAVGAKAGLPPRPPPGGLASQAAAMGMRIPAGATNPYGVSQKHGRCLVGLRCHAAVGLSTCPWGVDVPLLMAHVPSSIGSPPSHGLSLGEASARLRSFSYCRCGPC